MTETTITATPAATPGATLLALVTVALRLPLPRGRALRGTLLYGALTFGAAFGLVLYLVVLSVWLDDEPLSAGLVAGAGIVLAGVWAGALRAARPRHPGGVAMQVAWVGRSVGRAWRRVAMFGVLPLVVAGMGAPAAAHARVDFDRAFGIDVDLSDGATGDFENCTSASGCAAGLPTGVAGGMRDPFGVAVDVQGRILVADEINHRIDVFTVAGDGTVAFDRGFGVNVDPSDGTTGDFENCTAASGCQMGTGNGAAGGMRLPTGVGVDAQGRILVADEQSNRISRFTVADDGTVSFDRAFGFNVDPTDGPTGEFENCTTATGCVDGWASGAAGGMNQPQAVALDAQGRVLVTDSLNHRVDRFSVAGDGTVSFDRAFGIDVDSDTITGVFQNCTNASGCQPGDPNDAAAGGLPDPFGIAVDAQNRILVAQPGGERIDRFALNAGGVVFDRAFGIDVDPSDGTSGDFENCTTASGCQRGNITSGAAGGMPDPFGVAVDAQGGILVADHTLHRVNRFVVNGDGTVAFDRAFGVNVDPSDGTSGDFENCTSASGCQAGLLTGVAGGLNTPVGVAVDAQGRIVVAELGGDRISRFAVDTTPPTVVCGAADGAWHATDVSIACTASDDQSGLADPADAGFSVTTNVPAGTEEANAATDTHQVCDQAGNCTTAGPITANKIDKQQPSISIVRPSATTYTLNEVVRASYTCADGGSGVDVCAGAAADGAAIDTSVAGTHDFTVNARDGAGNEASQTVAYAVAARTDTDADDDGINDPDDNCVNTPNPSQANSDGDAQGDACDPDDDNDGDLDPADNCVFAPNPDQLDSDGDGLGDLCDPDRDGDGVPNTTDNCADAPNPGQEDADSDGIGDACETALPGRMTGGGKVGNVSHGFTLTCAAGDRHHGLEVNQGSKNFKLTRVTSALCGDNPAVNPGNPDASFDTLSGGGTGKYNRVAGATATWVFVDGGEPGTKDRMTITVKNAAGHIVIQAAGLLEMGNHQAHHECRATAARLVREEARGS